MSIKRQIFEIIRHTVIEILAIINCYSKIAVSNIAHSDVNIDALFTLSKQHGYHRLLRQKAAKYHIRTQKYTKLHTQNMTQNYT